MGCGGGGGILGEGGAGKDQQNINSIINFSQRHTTVLSTVYAIFF